MNAAERIVEWIWDWRRALVLACLAFTLAAGWQAARIEVDNSLEIWFVEDDPVLVSYRSFQQAYGNDETVVIAFHNPDGIVTESGISLLEQAKAALQHVDGVAAVDSILDYSDTFTGEEGARSQILSNPLLVNRLVSRDGSSALLVVRMEPLEEMDRERDAILARIDEALEPMRTPHHKAGFGVLYASLNEISMVDGFGLFCAAAGLILVLLIVFYRRLVPALVTLAIAAAATVWTMGIYGAAGRSLNMVTSILPTLVLVVTTATCVHVLLHVAAVPRVVGRKVRIIEGVGFMIRPCVLNTLTTAAGLLSLAASPLPVVRDLGVFAATGLVGALALTLIGCVWALAWARAEPVPIQASPLQWLASSLTEFSIRRPRTVLACATMVLALMIMSASQVEVDTYTIDFLYEDHPVRRDSDFIETRIAPYTPLEFDVRAHDDVLRLHVLRAVDRWQRDAEGIAGIVWSYSFVDVIKHMHRLAAGGDPTAYTLPRTQAALEALLAHASSSPNFAGLSALVDDPDGLRVTFGIPMQSARGLEQTIGLVEAEANLPADVGVMVAGYMPLYVRMTNDIVNSQIWSFTLAFITVFAAIGLLFRSARVAALAIPANVIPVVFILGVMGLADIRLDVATVTIAAVVLGLVVDDTVHFLHRLCNEYANSGSHVQAVRASARTVGLAILMTTIVLAIGFSVFGLADIKSIVWFGLLIATGLVAAVIADLVIMPALTVELEPRLGATRAAIRRPHERGVASPDPGRATERQHAK